MKRIDLTGQRFGRLTVIRYDHAEHDGAHWLCKCDCGTEKVLAGYSLRSGKTKSCGCLNAEASRAKLEKAREALKARPRKDLTGQRFGRLVVLGLADVPDRKGFIFWRVRCDCGTEKVIMQNNFILRLEYIAHFNKWLDSEPPRWRFIRWRKWINSRPVWKDAV